jgi:hypothetical protein
VERVQLAAAPCASAPVPPADKEPDATIVGRAPQLGLVAARRVSAVDALASGNLVVGLDVELGVAVLRHIRAFV